MASRGVGVVVGVSGMAEALAPSEGSSGMLREVRLD
jgi:hypothetical protein